jgi:hypothetical protein
MVGLHAAHPPGLRYVIVMPGRNRPKLITRNHQLNNAIVETESEVLASAGMLHEWADMVIENVRGQSDDRLVELARDAQNLEKAAFRVRGACGAELKRRIMERQSSGSLTGGDDAGIGKQMSALAKEIGVAPKTLADDTRIFETFSADLQNGAALDREHYRVALSAPDPRAALDLAVQQRESNSGYNTRDFREDVKKLQGIEFPENGQRGKGLNVKLGEEAAKALEELRRTSDFADMDNTAIVTHALVDLMIKTPRR